VTVPGTLREIHVQAGERVVAGQPIARIENVDMELAVERLDSERSELEVRLSSLRQRSLTDESASLEIAQLEEAIAAVEQRLANRRRDLDSLIVRAPVNGVVLPPPHRPRSDNTATLPTWSGRPLDDANRGAHLLAGTLLCQVGDPGKLEAVLAVDQAYAPYVHEGQRVDIQLESRPGHLLTSNLAQVARVNMKSAPAALSMKSGGALATSSDSHGRERPFSATYQASTPLDIEDTGDLGNIGDREIGNIGPIAAPINSRARARIHAGYRPLGTRAWDTLGRTFR
jgi:putative peptide zinc metalloprotease protein